MATRAPRPDQLAAAGATPVETMTRLRWYGWLRALARQPSATLTAVGASRSGRRTAGAALLLVAVGYSLVELFLHLADWTPLPGPALRTPAEEFYAWAAVLCTPSMLGAWLFATALLRLLARWAGGTGSFERLAAATASATAVGTSASMLPDLITSDLGIYDDLHGPRTPRPDAGPAPQLADRFGHASTWRTREGRVNDRLQRLLTDPPVPHHLGAQKGDAS